MSRESRKGASFETAVEKYLQWALDDDRIMRLTKHGVNDIGDIGNVRLQGDRVCVECKNAKRMEWTGWWRESVIESGNYDAQYCVVICKVKGRGLGLKSMAHQCVYMTPGMLDSFLASCSHDQHLKVKGESYRPSKRLPFIAIPLHIFALVLNDFLPLGPEGE